MYGRGPEKIPEAGAHREISRFPGGPVRHCMRVTDEQTDRQNGLLATARLNES